MSLLTKNGKQSNVIKWAVGIVTAPRDSISYLPRTLSSLEKTGWDNPVIFAEPDAPIPSSFSGPVVRRRKQFGDWSNWAVGLYELLLTEPDADFFLMLEDDVVFCRNLRIYIESYLDQLLPFASVSLYCPERYSRPGMPAFINHCQGWETCSTVTVIMPKQSVISFFSSNCVQRHRFEHIFALPPDEIPWGINVDPKNSVKDAVIGTWAEENNLPVFYHVPSLVEHIGIRSVIGAQYIRKTNDFPGESFEPDWGRVLMNRRYSIYV